MTAAEATDGRRARRDRNRAAVIEAMITLLLEQGGLPQTDVVAARAGVSVSSVFRYFENLDDLQQQTIETYFARFGSLFEVPAIGDGTLDERITRLVDARATLHETVAPVARLVRSSTHEETPVTERLARLRLDLAEQVRRHFAAELSGRTRNGSDDVADAIDVLTSFEAWDLLRSAHGRSEPQIRRAWTTAIRSLLGAT